MKSRKITKYLVFALLVCGTFINAQTLTIINGGNTGTSGANWSITGNTLTVTGTASIDASVIENHLTNTGPLTIVGNTTPPNLQVSVNEAINVSSGSSSLVIGASDNKGGITTTQTITLSGSISFHGGWVRLENNVETTGSGAKILAKANEPVSPVNATDGFISLSLGTDLTTNGGDIILWSNATNRTSGQANNEIILLGTNTLSTSGGKIVIAGGLDNGSNGGTASDDIPDGYAYRGSYGGRPIDIKASVTLNSGGGEIIIRGEQNGSDVAVGADATFTISNGGAVTIEGKNTTATSVALGTANITSTATNSPVTISGTTHITNSGLTTITTQGGDVLLASNVDDATDGETTTNGYIRMVSGLSVTTNGGDITIGGGDATGSGYALGSTASPAEGIRIDGTVSLNSGNGNIALRGKSAAVALANNVGGGAIMFYNVINGSINSGTGTLLLDGYSQTTSGNAIAGLLWWNDPTPSTFTITSANTTTSAITLNGYSTSSSGQSYGIEVEGTNTLNVYATGTGGGISINGGRAVSNTDPDQNLDIVFRGPVNILANSGPISIKGGQLGGVSNGYWFTGLQTQIGSKASTAVASSASDITIAFDRFWFDGNYFPKLATTGTVTIEPISVGFGMGISSSWFQYNQNSQTMNGLTLGKAGNTADINHDITAISVAGPISVYGGNIGINENLNTSAGAADGDVLLKASGNNNLANGKSITTSGGDVTFWSDSDGNGTGYAQVGSSTAITTAGGNITLGGGSDIATGYARGAAERDAETDNTNFLHISGVHLKNSASLSSGGGNITLRGQNYPSSVLTMDFGVMGHNATLDAGSGKVAIIGKATGSGTSNTQAISVYGNGWTIRSSNSDADAIVLDGDGSDYSGNTTTLGINFAGIIESTGGGGIQLTGKSGTAAGYDHPLDIYGSILANSGTITITAENNVATQDGLYLDGATFGFKPATNVTASTSNIILKSDNTVFNSATNLNTTGAVSLLPLDASPSFGVAQTIGSNMVLSSGVSGLTIGKSGNTADITMAQTQTIAGPISVYGGTLTLNTNLTTTNGGDISLYTDNNLGGLSSVRTITADGAFKLIPNSTSFSSNISFPITNLNVSSNGLTIGKTGNTSDITMSSDFSTGGAIALYGATVALQGNLITTNGNLTLAASTNANLAAGKVVDVAGDVINNGPLNLLANNSGYSQLRFTGSYSGTGTVTQQQYIATAGWHNIANPFSNQKAGSFGTVGTNRHANAQNLRYWDAATTYTWVNVADNDVNLDAGRGYLGYFGDNGTIVSGLVTGSGPWTLSLSGTPLSSVAMPVAYNVSTILGAWQDFDDDAQKDGWNLVANPFTCILDFESITPNAINGSFYVFDPSTGSSGAYVAWSGASPNDGLIAPTQSFWVQATGAGASLGTLTMTAHGTTSKTAPSFNKTQSTEFDRIVLRVKDQQAADWQDQTIVALIEGTDNGYDPDWDAHKWLNPGTAPSLYSLHGKMRLANNAVSYSWTAVGHKSIPVGFSSTVAGAYSITFDDNWMLRSYYLLLEDRVTGTMHDLVRSGNYSFTHDPAITNRFILHIGNQPITLSGPSASLDAGYWAEAFHIASLAYTGEVSCYLRDITGRELWQATGLTIAQGETLVLPFDRQVAPGTYVLTVVAQDRTYTVKVTM